MMSYVMLDGRDYVLCSLMVVSLQLFLHYNGNRPRIMPTCKDDLFHWILTLQVSDQASHFLLSELLGTNGDHLQRYPQSEPLHINTAQTSLGYPKYTQSDEMTAVCVTMVTCMHQHEQVMGYAWPLSGSVMRWHTDFRICRWIYFWFNCC